MEEEQISVLDALYSRFFRVMPLGGGYPYVYEAGHLQISKSSKLLHSFIQRGNFIFILAMMTCHIGLVLSTTQFFTDINQVNLLIQLPWVVGLPLSLSMNISEMTFRDFTISSITMWRRLEHSILGEKDF
jgi:hypothetical protein